MKQNDLYYVQDGIPHLGYKLSNLEKNLIDGCCSFLKEKGMNYLSIPSCIKKETITKQEVISSDNVFKLYVENDATTQHQYLSGSAEQGILELISSPLIFDEISNPDFNKLLIYALNTCYRTEASYIDLFRVKEFKKVEQFAFCTEHNWKDNFELLLCNAVTFLGSLNLQMRITSRTKLDPGYHIKKYDIEVKTKQYGWMETHSCTYFGNEQIKRFAPGLKHIHTISNTGIASPRILIPFIENGII